MLGRVVELASLGQPGLLEHHVRQVLEVRLVAFEALDERMLGVDLEDALGLRALLARGPEDFVTELQVPVA